MHRFLPAIASQIGVRIEEVVVNHRKRESGTSKYGLSRTIRVVLDLVTVKFLLSYSTRPLQIFGLLGIGATALGALITAYLGYVRLILQQPIAERTPLLLVGVLLVFIGVQLVTFGLLAELLARTYYESQNKPVYVIREILQTPDMAHVDIMTAGRAPRRRSGQARARPADHRHPTRAVRRAPLEGRQVPRSGRSAGLAGARSSHTSSSRC